MIYWKECPDVETTPDVMSGKAVVKGTRILAQGVVDDASDGYTPERIAAEIYEGLSVDAARRIIELARKPRHASPR
jgi:uncharacterized protein (DUF433 family)